MLHLVEHVRYLLSAGISRDGRKWRAPAQCIARLAKPRHGVLTILEHHHGESQDSRQANETIRGSWIQAGTPLPTRPSSQTDLEQAILLGGSQFQRFGNSLIGAHRKTPL